MSGRGGGSVKKRKNSHGNGAGGRLEEIGHGQYAGFDQHAMRAEALRGHSRKPWRRRFGGNTSVSAQVVHRKNHRADSEKKKSEKDEFVMRAGDQRKKGST